MGAPTDAIQSSRPSCLCYTRLPKAGCGKFQYQTYLTFPPWQSPSYILSFGGFRKALESIRPPCLRSKCCSKHHRTSSAHHVTRDANLSPSESSNACYESFECPHDTTCGSIPDPGRRRRMLLAIRVSSTQSEPKTRASKSLSPSWKSSQTESIEPWWQRSQLQPRTVTEKRHHEIILATPWGPWSWLHLTIWRLPGRPRIDQATVFAVRNQASNRQGKFPGDLLFSASLGVTVLGRPYVLEAPENPANPSGHRVCGQNVCPKHEHCPRPITCPTTRPKAPPKAHTRASNPFQCPIKQQPATSGTPSHVADCC